MSTPLIVCLLIAGVVLLITLIVAFSPKKEVSLVPGVVAPASHRAMAALDEIRFVGRAGALHDHFLAIGRGELTQYGLAVPANPIAAGQAPPS